MNPTPDADLFNPDELPPPTDADIDRADEEADHDLVGDAVEIPSPTDAPADAPTEADAL